jgi:hypothetical protein
MKAILVVLSSILILLACSKDKFETKPQIDIKSAEPKVVPQNGNMIVDLAFTDKEGDLDAVYIWKVRLNKIVRPTVRDSIPPRQVPEFPKNQKGELELNLDYQLHLISAQTPRRDPITGRLEPDTLNMKFVVKDKAGNVSDTSYLNNIVILRD